MLGIIGAMDIEVEALYERMTETEVRTIAGMEFHKGKLASNAAFVATKPVNAGICSQILADCYHVTEIINTGVAGSLKAEINIGDIVLSSTAVQHDVDAGVFSYPPGEIPGLGIREFPADEKLLALAKECCERVNPEIQVFTGRVASGDQFIDSKEKKTRIHDTFDACCTEMEGAAIAQAAWLNKIPYLIIRSISDKADDSAHMDYDVFEAKAAANSVRLVTAMAKALSH